MVFMFSFCSMPIIIAIYFFVFAVGRSIIAIFFVYSLATAVADQPDETRKYSKHKHIKYDKRHNGSPSCDLLYFKREIV